MSIIESATNDTTAARRFLNGDKMDYLTKDTTSSRRAIRPVGVPKKVQSFSMFGL